jgi:lantibiotic modifying enzyme
MSEGFGANHSLCHGDPGNLDFLLTALQSYPELYPAEHMALLQASLLESIEGKQIVSGVPMGVEAPGLMLGLAGTGYALLRQADPTRVPSLLQLAPPTNTLE